MPTFPSYAKILTSGYGEKRESALLRTEMESGPPKQAKIKSRVMVERQVTILLRSRDDYLAFVEWFASELDEGTNWFDFYDPVKRAVRSGRFSGGGLEASPSGSMLSEWSITAKLETWG